MLWKDRRMSSLNTVKLFCIICMYHTYHKCIDDDTRECEVCATRFSISEVREIKAIDHSPVYMGMN